MLQRIKAQLNKGFVRNVLLVAGGTAGAQAITMAFAPIITRLYGPEAFGLQAAFVALLAVLLPISALTYPIAMVLPKDDRAATTLGWLSLTLASLLSLLLFLLLVFFLEPLALLLNMSDIQPFLWLLPLALWLAAVQQILSQWVIRQQLFKISAHASIWQALILNISKSGIGLLTPVAGVLIWLSALSAGINAAIMWLGLRFTTKLKPAAAAHHSMASEPFNDSTAVVGAGYASRLIGKTGSQFKDMLHLAKAYGDFPIFRAPQVLLNAISHSVPVILLGIFFGPAAAGFFGLGKTVLLLPATLIGKSVGDVFYPRITKAAQQQQAIRPLLLKASLLMAAFGLPVFALVMAFGPWLFGWVFGEQWQQAGEYARWMALWMFFAFLNRPAVAAMATLALQKSLLYFELSSLLLRLLALYLGFVVFASDLVAVALFSILGALVNLLLVLYTLAKANAHTGR